MKVWREPYSSDLSHNKTLIIIDLVIVRIVQHYAAYYVSVQISII